MGTVRKSFLIKDGKNSMDESLDRTSFKNKNKEQLNDNSKSYASKRNEIGNQAMSGSRQGKSRIKSVDSKQDLKQQSESTLKLSRTKVSVTSRSSKSNSSLASSSATSKSTRNLTYSEQSGKSVSRASSSGIKKSNVKPEPKVSSSTSSQEKLRTSESKVNTMTLQKLRDKKNGAAVREKIGPDKNISTDKNEKKLLKSEEKKEDRYSDVEDYEDYESDFQECTDSDESQVIEESDDSVNSLNQMDPIHLSLQKKSNVVRLPDSPKKTEEERMLDSGHYELAEARKRAAKIESIASTPLSPVLSKFSNNTPYRGEQFSENKSLPLSMDEGFEDERGSGDFAKYSLSSRISIVNPKKTAVSKQSRSRARSRGRQLLEMIKLDEMEWSLLECAPIPYEEFIRSYGKLNTRQMATQTAEDNVDSDVQTDEIVCSNKWTQFPVKSKQILGPKEETNSMRMELLSVGSDDDKPSVETAQKPPHFDILRLNDFLNKAARVTLALLEAEKFAGNVHQADTQGLPFSEGSIKLSVNSVTFLAGRPVTILHYSEISTKVLLTIHSPNDEGIETANKEDYITDCCIGCVWNILEPSVPTKLFYSPCPITACCFHPMNHNIVFAGLEDGSINLWDLKEDEQWHWKIRDEANQTNWLVRSPTYTTAGINDANALHNSKIVSLRVLSKFNKNSAGAGNNFVVTQICSLDEEGRAMVWSVLRAMGINVEDDIGLAPWGQIRLVKSQDVTVNFTKNQSNFAGCVDMNVDSMDNNNIYIATNTSQVLHATCIGNKTIPSLYAEKEIDSCGNATCIETCPFERSFFLVGCDDGTIRLHASNALRPLIQLKDKHHARKIKALSWSKSRPFVIYALDESSRIHVWNFGTSDVRPILSVSTNHLGHAESMQLSAWKTERDMGYQYLALGTRTGDVRVHKLTSDFSYSRKDDLLQELTTFMRYVALL